MTALRQQAIYETKVWHGFSKWPEYKAYHQAKVRCQLSNHPNFKWYGGRGIEFRFTSFQQFFSLIGFRPSPDHSLDRIDNSGHYEPGNVRWATPKEQMNNRRVPKGRGVRYRKDRAKPYLAFYCEGGKEIYLGCFLTPEEAAEAVRQRKKA